ncbi:hypothetical protein GALMADRAFT_112269 [Galerina marginata CBS 339.88]|uniref:RNA polymerase II-associated protein 1 C-terminal domain-containing protein n=1 Tax=Galerina marginata (strain CBS 339.88) TaxID=685588 RepID=A0A067THD4_GALM3|nr:hypothetical protein GALMADRAFT_112269 [Galerina marginata CBS 339.88]
MAQTPPIIGSIVERRPSSSNWAPKPSSSSKTGFPTVQHRSKSAFSRNREEQRKLGGSRLKDAPTVSHSNKTPLSPPPEPDDWRQQISRDNEDRVAAMTDEEREEERRQILDRFGAQVGDILKRARQARIKKQEKAEENVTLPVANRNPIEGHSQPLPIPVTQEERKNFERARSPPPSSMTSPNSSRPSSRADRRLRFAELEPGDVHVYVSAPPSPKRRAIALPPPDPNASAPTVSLGQWKGKMVPQNLGPPQPEPPKPEAVESQEPEEGSAEYIRRKFFPFAPKDDPNLAWMDVDSAPVSDSSTSSLRFDLQGNPIPPSVSLSLPTHLGLHHHAEGSRAGYTLDDIFLLSRSTVPAQRATMLGILARIARRLEEMKKGRIDGMEELVGKEGELRKRILAAGVEAMSSRGNVGTRAIEVVWECIVGWIPEAMDVEGVEMDSSPDSPINTLPLEFFLPQVTTMLSQGAIPPESATQLLSVLHRLAQHNTATATSIVSTQKLLPTVLEIFLLAPVPQHDSSQLPHPDPLALRLFHTLAVSSRANALEIEKLADPLLRFVTYSSFDSPYPPALSINLLTSTLRLYCVLASYGLYCHIAGTAVEQLAHIEQYVISEACTSNTLTITWANLVEAWIVCATDPHQTTPPHDIKWSQVVGWNWSMGISEIQDRLGSHEKDWVMWTATWQAQAAWLEGAKINGIKGGEAERSEFIDTVKTGFESGREHDIVMAALDKLQKELEGYQSEDMDQLEKMASYFRLLTSLIRLWLACIPPHSEGLPSSPPFSLLFGTLSELARRLLNHPLWSLLALPDAPLPYLYCREMSQFLSYYLRLSERLPGTAQSLWLAQAFSIVLKLIPGDEDHAQTIIKDLANQLNQQWATSQGIQVSPLIWERGGLGILEPFLFNMMRPLEDVYIGPLTMTPQSIKSSTTQRLSSLSSLQQLGLPLRRDWTMSPLDHLLRSGDSSVFKALPISWDSSEVEVARASLFLTKIAQEALLNFSITSFVLTREEAEFGCMKVFMLEHGQPQNDSAEEVFRDSVVERLMEDILRPYTASSPDAHIVSSVSQEGDLERVAARFLGPSVPFFQFYTDFVSLYDAISFSHPLFALLLIPPISMRYLIDYRKHFWCDFNHVVRTIRISPAQVLSADIREYFYPIETDPQIIASYLSSILKENVHDFMRLVALHHIASNIWPDLRDQALENEDRASALLKAVVGQASLNVLRDVVRYRQTLSGPILLPPSCFGAIDGVRSSRMELVLRWGGQSVADRLVGLLNE